MYCSLLADLSGLSAKFDVMKYYPSSIVPKTITYIVYAIIPV
jgi:hypothetical protein